MPDYVNPRKHESLNERQSLEISRFILWEELGMAARRIAAEGETLENQMAFNEIYADLLKTGINPQTWRHTEGTA